LYYFVLFVALSANARRRLKMLAKTAYLRHKPQCRELLLHKASPHGINSCVNVEQQKWIQQYILECWHGFVFLGLVYYCGGGSVVDFSEGKV